MKCWWFFSLFPKQKGVTIILNFNPVTAVKFGNVFEGKNHATYFTFSSVGYCCLTHHEHSTSLLQELKFGYIQFKQLFFHRLNHKLKRRQIHAQGIYKTVILKTITTLSSRWYTFISCSRETTYFSQCFSIYKYSNLIFFCEWTNTCKRMDKFRSLYIIQICCPVPRCCHSLLAPNQPVSCYDHSLMAFQWS